MKQTYQTDFRPNHSLLLSGIWSLNGVASAASLYFWLAISAQASLTITLVFWLPALYYLFFARAHSERQSKLTKKSLNYLSLRDLQKRIKPDQHFLGTGFDWTAQNTQEVADLYQNHEELDRIRARGDGATFLHGLGTKRERDVYLTDEETKGHTLIVGTTGAGKTRAADLIVSQCVLRNEPLIVIDPKGDQELKNNIEAAYQKAGRGDQFSFFHPAFPSESCAINCLANYQRESELASRIAAIIPTGTGGEVFQSYSQSALMSLFYGIIAGGEDPTILDIHEPLSLGCDRIVYRAIDKWAERSGVDLPEKLGRAYGANMSEAARADIAVKFYQSVLRENDDVRDHDLDGLVSLFEHDRTHFSKMVASLVPVVAQLCAGSLKELLSPSRRAGRLPKS
ncbi:MAG: DUF87 domain-containing protein, partial [Pseudomonadota bacterium]